MPGHFRKKSIIISHHKKRRKAITENGLQEICEMIIGNKVSGLDDIRNKVPRGCEGLLDGNGRSNEVLAEKS